MQTHYDYIILGAGLSGYTMALRMQEDVFFKDKTIALIDPNFEKGNDRTWCFWEDGEGYFEHLVSYRWNQILVAGNGLKDAMAIAPYQYKKVEGEDVYAFAKAQLKNSNITFVKGKVNALSETKKSVRVETNQGTYTASYILNSIYQPEVLAQQNKVPVLQQHFVGWFIKTEHPVFEPNIATYMDFTVPQKGNCRFMYVLPTSTTEALLEYTLFSEALLPPEEYEEAIAAYLNEKGISDYIIIRKEQGCIPMTVYDFTKHNTERVVYIGTAGGWTKASTGYTFKNTVKRSKELLHFLKSEKPFTAYALRNRWTFYDGVLLEALTRHNHRGAEIFTGMFSSGDPRPMFRFLDEESFLQDELKVIWSSPKRLFAREALRYLTKI